MDCPTCDQACKSEKGMKQHHTRSHDTSLNSVTLDCNYCGTEFTANKNDVKNVEHSFCSSECENSWRSNEYSGSGHHNHKEKVVLECEYCEESYKEYPYRADESRFCSQECSGKYKTNRGTEQVLCDWCDNPFKKCVADINRSEHNFCSKSCYGEWSSLNKTGQNHPNWTGGSNLYEAIRENLSDESWSKIAELNRQGSCYKCGKQGKELHEHHIIPIMYGGTNAEDLLMTLCPSCHRTVEKYTMNELQTNIIEVV